MSSGKILTLKNRPKVISRYQMSFELLSALEFISIYQQTDIWGKEYETIPLYYLENVETLEDPEIIQDCIGTLNNNNWDQNKKSKGSYLIDLEFELAELRKINIGINRVDSEIITTSFNTYINSFISHWNESGESIYSFITKKNRLNLAERNKEKDLIDLINNHPILLGFDHEGPIIPTDKEKSKLRRVK